MSANSLISNFKIIQTKILCFSKSKNKLFAVVSAPSKNSSMIAISSGKQQQLKIGDHIEVLFDNQNNVVITDFNGVLEYQKSVFFQQYKKENQNNVVITDFNGVLEYQKSVFFQQYKKENQYCTLKITKLISDNNILGQIGDYVYSFVVNSLLPFQVGDVVQISDSRIYYDYSRRYKINFIKANLVYEKPVLEIGQEVNIEVINNDTRFFWCKLTDYNLNSCVTVAVMKDTINNIYLQNTTINKAIVAYISNQFIFIDTQAYYHRKYHDQIAQKEVTYNVTEYNKQFSYFIGCVQLGDCKLYGILKPTELSWSQTTSNNISKDLQQQLYQKKENIAIPVILNMIFSKLQHMYHFNLLFSARRTANNAMEQFINKSQLGDIIDVTCVENGSSRNKIKNFIFVSYNNLEFKLKQRELAVQPDASQEMMGTLKTGDQLTVVINRYDKSNHNIEVSKRAISYDILDHSRVYQAKCICTITQDDKIHSLISIKGVFGIIKNVDLSNNKGTNLLVQPKTIVEKSLAEFTIIHNRYADNNNQNKIKQETLKNPLINFTTKTN